MNKVVAFFAVVALCQMACEGAHSLHYGSTIHTSSSAPHTSSTLTSTPLTSSTLTSSLPHSSSYVSSYPGDSYASSSGFIPNSKTYVNSGTYAGDSHITTGSPIGSAGIY